MFLGQHESGTFYSLINTPEIFVINLQYAAEPNSLDILRTLVSLPN